MHLDALLVDTFFVQGLLEVLLCRDRAQLALFVVPLHVEVERFEVFELFCRDFICYGYFPEDLATFIESEHVIQIHWTLWDPIHANDRENIQTDTENLKVKDIAHILEIGDDQDLVDYIEHEKTWLQAIFILLWRILRDVNEGAVVAAHIAQAHKEVQEEGEGETLREEEGAQKRDLRWDWWHVVDLASIAVWHPGQEKLAA